MVKFSDGTQYEITNKGWIRVDENGNKVKRLGKAEKKRIKRERVKMRKTNGGN